MSRHKKGAFNKKAARVREANAASAAAIAVSAVASDSRNGIPGRQALRADLGAGFHPGASNNGTSMMELGRNTTRKDSHWDHDTRLRDRPIGFVSGGLIEPSKEPQSGHPKTRTISEVEDQDKKQTESQDGAQFKKKVTKHTEEEVITVYIPKQDNKPSDSVSTETEKPGVDKPEAQRSVLCAPIQKDTKIIPTSTVKAVLSPAPPMQQSIDSATHGSSVCDSSVVDQGNDTDSSEDIILFKGRGSRRHNRPEMYRKPARAASPPDELHFPAHLYAASDDENGDAAMDDYISNFLIGDMQDTVLQNRTAGRDLGDPDTAVVVECPDNATKDNLMSDSDSDSDHEIVLDAGEKDEEDKNDDETEDEAWGFSADIDDEELARLFAKQEELGLRGHELLLLDGDAWKGTAPKKLRKRTFRKRSKMSASGMDFTKNLTMGDGTYPSAESVADIFEQLQMTGGNGGRKSFQLSLSDSELGADLRATWQKDRQRKKERKKLRENLRANGLLGRHANPNDPRAKYPNGMDVSDIKAEFRSFLLGTEASLTLPPMDARTRKIIHEVAHHLNIKSKSAGSGDQRRPMLARTKATPRYDEDIFPSLFARIQRRYFPRSDANRDGPGRLKRGRLEAGRHGNAGDAGIRHGEIVGGAAPEIGQANKGRALLEKMGWSMGMALGAMDNKGITQPIEHVIMRSKAGLG